MIKLVIKRFNHQRYPQVITTTCLLLQIWTLLRWTSLSIHSKLNTQSAISTILWLLSEVSVVKKYLFKTNQSHHISIRTTEWSLKRSLSPYKFSIVCMMTSEIPIKEFRLLNQLSTGLLKRSTSCTISRSGRSRWGRLLISLHLIKEISWMPSSPQETSING